MHPQSNYKSLKVKLKEKNNNWHIYFSEDVLMFLTGQEEIETMAQQIRQIVRVSFFDHL